MGGKKRPTISQLEKRVMKEQEKTQKEESRSKPKMSFTSEGRLTQVSLDAIYREISKLPYVTPFIVHNQFNLRISEAKRVLSALEQQGLLKLVDANRRVRIYVPVAG